jgi:Stigma-specific protein, Stig1
MPKEDHSSDRSHQGLPQGGVELSLDELAKGLATGTLSRGKAIRWMGGALLGAALASVPGVAWANDCRRLGRQCRRDSQCCSRNCIRQGEEKVCACPDGRTPCNDRCVNLERNENHCGACGFRCPEGEECEGGVCEGGACAPPSLELCEVGFPPCAGDTCFCFEVTETPGQGRCISDFFCSDVVSCPNGQIDCPTGFTCVTNTCCGAGVQLCVPDECSVGVTSQVSQGGGPTGSGVPH